MATPWRHARDIAGPYRKLWLGMYLGKLGLALLITLPMLILIQSDLDQSTFARPLLSEWSVDIIGELILTKENVLSSGLLLLVALGVAAFVAKQFLNGGIYDVLVNRAPLDSRRFFSQSADMFTNHLWVGLLMILVYIALFATAVFFTSLVVPIARKLLPSHDLTRFVIRVGLTYAIMIVGVVYSDLVRIHLTHRRQAGLATKIRDSFKSAYLFFVRHGVKSLGLYASYFVPFVLIWLAIEGLALAVTGGLGSMLGAVIEFVLFQACALIRVWQSLSATLALADLMQTAATPEPVVAPQEATRDGSTLLP